MSHLADMLIDIKNVSKSYVTATGSFSALSNISLRIKKGQMVAFTGKSGSGKSTILNIVTGIDKPTHGSISISGIEIGSLSENDLAVWRGKNIGIVFQFFQLLPTLTVAENVMLPMDFCGTVTRKERRTRAISLLEQVGIQDQADKFPSTLSGGQQQRAAIARALANDPEVIIADEPTGNLDSQNTIAILELFIKLAQTGKTVIVVTHEKEFTTYFPGLVTLSDGKIIHATGVEITEHLYHKVV
jgi:putative ABC transport system ATP-binding protein